MSDSNDTAPEAAPDNRPREAQAHGGALIRGGTPAALRRPPSHDRAAIRAMLRTTAAEQYNKLAKQWDSLPEPERVRLTDLGFKYGLGTQSQTLSPQAVEEQVRVLYDELVGLLLAHGHTEGSAWAFVRELIRRTKVAYARLEGTDSGEAVEADTPQAVAAQAVARTVRGALLAPVEVPNAGEQSSETEQTPAP